MSSLYLIFVFTFIYERFDQRATNPLRVCQTVQRPLIADVGEGLKIESSLTLLSGTTMTPTLCTSFDDKSCVNLVLKARRRVGLTLKIK